MNVGAVATHMGGASWRLRDVVLILVLYVPLQLGVLIGLAVLGLPTEAPTVPTSAGEVARQLAGSAAVTGAVLLTARRRGGVRALLPLQVPTRRWLGLTVIIVAVLVASKAVLLSVGPATNDVSRVVLVGGVLSVGVATAVEEELLYRGALYGWLSGVVRSGAAALLSAGVFAINHVGGQPGGVLNAFLFGMLFAGLYRRSGSLLPGMAVHAMNNAGSFVVIVLAA